jgi:hypothetical protein
MAGDKTASVPKAAIRIPRRGFGEKELIVTSWYSEGLVFAAKTHCVKSCVA